MTAPTQMLESSMISEDTSETVSRTSNFEVAGAAMTGLLESVQVSARSALHVAGLASFADGFAAASLLAALVAAAACILTVALVRANETAPSGVKTARPCKLIDCRDPL
jgi:hypothetical protein